MKRLSLILASSLFLSPCAQLFASSETPVLLSHTRSEEDFKEGVLWKAPNYKNQKAIGYSSKTFEIPEGMRKRVEFWKRIYSEYTTNQGLMHDSQNLDIVYRVVDFSPAMKEGASKRQVLKGREAIVKKAKKEIEERLERLQRHLDRGKTQWTLRGEDRRVWKLFSKVKGRKKFKEASRKGRLRLQLGQKDHFRWGLYYAGRYLPEMEQIFRQRNLPVELTRLPMVESSFNILAQSKVGASGIWQFMRYTAKPYLKMNRVVDHRNAPILATHAAAKLLRNNYRMLEDWGLAITGYNHGPTGVRRLTKKLGTRDIASLVERTHKPRFGFASQNFYASFLAVLEVEKEVQKYFPKLRVSRPLPTVAVRLPTPIRWKDLVSWFDGDTTRTRLYNPFFTSRVRRGLRLIPIGQNVYLPPEKKKQARRAIAQLSKRKMAVDRYRVRRGDTLSGIARRFGVSVRSLMRHNGVRSAHRIHAGQTLKIPN